MADNEVVKGVKEKGLSFGREMKNMGKSVPSVKTMLITQFVIQLVLMIWMIRHPDLIRSPVVAKIAPMIAILACAILYFQDKAKIPVPLIMLALLVFTVCFGMVAIQIMNPHWCESIMFAFALSAAVLTLSYGFGAHTSFELAPHEKPAFAVLLIALSVAAVGFKLPQMVESSSRVLLYASGFAVFMAVVQRTDGSGMEDEAEYSDGERLWLASIVHSSMIIIFAGTYAVVRKIWRY